MKIALGRDGHVYDVRKRQYLGERATFDAELAPGEARFFAILAKKTTGIKLDLKATQVAPGSRVVCEAQVLTDHQSTGKRVIRMEVIDPKGVVVNHYCANLIAVDGLAVYSFVTALNDAPGDWQIRVIDIASGVTQIATLKLTD